MIFLHHAMFYIDWLNLAFHKSWITFCIFQCWFLQSWRKTFFSYFPVWSVLISRQRLVSLFCMACPWKQARIWTFPSNVIGCNSDCNRAVVKSTFVESKTRTIESESRKSTRGSSPSQVQEVRVQVKTEYKRFESKSRPSTRGSSPSQDRVQEVRVQVKTEYKRFESKSSPRGSSPRQVQEARVQVKTEYKRLESK